MDRIGPALVAVRLAPDRGCVDAIEEVWARGDAVAPLAPDLPAPALAEALESLRPAALIDDAGEAALPDPAPTSPGTALVITTSGSTGAPKAVELSHAALTASARASLERLGADATADRWLACLPLAHVAGVMALVRSSLLGTPAVVHSRFDVGAVAGADATMMSLVPTMLGRLLDAGADLRRFRAILLGGAAPPAGLLEAAQAAGARVVVTYGMTETAGGCVYDGVPLDGVDVAVGASETGHQDEPVRPSREGAAGTASAGGETAAEGAGADTAAESAGADTAAEGAGDRIAVRGPVLFSGYRGQPGSGPGAGGWFVTADRGRWSGDGRLEVLGRLDDVIVSGGHNVSASALADLLRRHPGVTDAVVTGTPDPEWGHRVVATVVAADPTRPPRLDELRAFVAERAPAFTAPRDLHVVAELARSALGKPLGRPPDLRPPPSR